MKKLLLLGVAMFVFVSTAGAAEKMVFVDLNRLFEGFYKTQLAKSKIQVQQKDIDDEHQLMVDEMTKISEEVDVLKKEARDITLSQEIRDQKRILFEERVLELRDKQKEIEEFVQRRKKQIQMQVTRMSRTIMDEIHQSIDEYARREGLMAVIDSSKRNAAVGVFIYVHPDVDITQEVLVMLNSKRPDLDAEGDNLLNEDTTVEHDQEGASQSE